jgi:hypothetical protein
LENVRRLNSLVVPAFVTAIAVAIVVSLLGQPCLVGRASRGGPDETTVPPPSGTSLHHIALPATLKKASSSWADLDEKYLKVLPPNILSLSLQSVLQLR